MHVAGTPKRHGQNVRPRSGKVTGTDGSTERHAGLMIYLTTGRNSYNRYFGVERIGFDRRPPAGLVDIHPLTGPTETPSLGSGVAVGGCPGGAGPLRARAFTSLEHRSVPSYRQRVAGIDGVGVGKWI